MPRWLLVGFGILILVTGLMYWPVLGFEYINFDDGSFAGAFNRNQDLLSFFLGFRAFDYIPLTWLSFWLESLFVTPLVPAVSHGINLALHLINTGLLFYFLNQILSPRWHLILIACAVFALHPMNVESVVWVTERKGLLAFAFLFLSLIAYVKRLAAGDEWDSRSLSMMSLSFVFYTLAVLAKPVALVAPVVMVLIDFLIQRRVSVKKSLTEKAVFFVFAAVFAIVHIKARQSDTLLTEADFSIFQALSVFAKSLLFYPQQFLMPQGLRIFYSTDIGPGMSYVLVFALFAWSALRMSRSPLMSRELSFALLLYAVAILPQTKIVPYGLPFIFADRYFYFAGIGLILWALFLLDRRLQIRFRGRKWDLGTIAFCGLMVVTSLQTPRLIQTWRSSETVWLNVLRYEPGLLLAQNNLGLHWLDVDLNRAQEIFEEILLVDPKYKKAWINLAHIAEQRQNLPKALDILEKARRFLPEDQQISQMIQNIRAAKK